MSLALAKSSKSSSGLSFAEVALAPPIAVTQESWKEYPTRNWGVGFCDNVW